MQKNIFKKKNFNFSVLKSAQKANKYLSHGENNAIKWYKNVDSEMRNEKDW